MWQTYWPGRRRRTQTWLARSTVPKTNWTRVWQDSTDWGKCENVKVCYSYANCMFLTNPDCLSDSPSLSISLRSMSRRRGRLHELTPCRSVQSAPPCHLQAEIKRAQIVPNRSQPGLSILRRQSLGGPQMQAWRARERKMVLTGVGTTQVAKERQAPSTDSTDRSGWSVRDRTALLETKPCHFLHKSFTLNVDRNKFCFRRRNDDL